MALGHKHTQKLLLLCGFLVGAFVYLALHIYSGNYETGLTRELQTTLTLPFWAQPPANKTVLIPNIVHFVKLATSGTNQLEFTEMVSIISARNIQECNDIMVHANQPITGLWWEELNRQVKVTLVLRMWPRILDSNVTDILQAVNVLKMEALRMYGGIVLDLDCYFIHPINNLRSFPFVIGKNGDAAELSMSVMMAHKNSEFLHYIYKSFEINYGIKNFEPEASIFGIYKDRPKLVHVEPFRISSPDLSHRHLVFGGNIRHDWRNLYVVHLMFKNDNLVYNPEYIKKLKNLVGEVLRYIYYGRSDILS